MIFNVRSPEWYINDPQEVKKILRHLVKIGRGRPADRHRG